MPGITISASYGAGGSAVAPAVARLLDWPLVDRAISSAVAEALHMSVQAAEQGGPPPSRLNRFLLSLAVLAPQPLPFEEVADADAQHVRDTTEQMLKEKVASGAVVLGRAGACALLHDPTVLRVRLYGAPGARERQAARLEEVDAATARSRREAVDRARDAYVQRLYGRRADDPSLYHLQIDGTALPLDAVVHLVVQAYRALAP
jgi:cytidylate kinase